MKKSALVSAALAAVLCACEGRPAPPMEAVRITVGGAQGGGGSKTDAASMREIVRKIGASRWEMTRGIVLRVDPSRLGHGEIWVELERQVRKTVYGGRPKMERVKTLLVQFDPVHGARQVSVVPAAAGTTMDGQIVYLTEVSSAAVTEALEDAR